MKKYAILIILIICVVSCSSYYVTRQPQALMGSWQRTIRDNGTPYTARLTFNEDQTFSFVIENPILGHVNTHSQAIIMPKKIAFLSDSQCKNAGIYAYYIENNETLVFTPENDMCTIRKNTIEGIWTRVIK